MNFTYAERYDAAVEACKQWLPTKWGLHYQEMLRYLPEADGEAVRTMLQQAIKQALSHTPNTLLTATEVNRQYCNLLDSHRLDALEAKMELFKNAAEQTQKAATEAQRRQAAAKAIQDKLDADQAFQQSIADRQAEDARNRDLAKTKEGLRELRRRALFEDRTQGHVTTTPMPHSVRR